MAKNLPRLSYKHFHWPAEVLFSQYNLCTPVETCEVRRLVVDMRRRTFVKTSILNCYTKPSHILGCNLGRADSILNVRVFHYQIILVCKGDDVVIRCSVLLFIFVALTVVTSPNHKMLCLPSAMCRVYVYLRST
jgi:hypothetical protein